MFHAGDRVCIIGTNMTGTVISSTGAPYTIEVLLDAQVYATRYAAGDLTQLGSASPTLPQGQGYAMHQSQAYVGHTDEMMTPEVASQVNTPVCDCGGFKTYKVWTAESHSPWCRSQGVW